MSAFTARHPLFALSAMLSALVICNVFLIMMLIASFGGWITLALIVAGNLLTFTAMQIKSRSMLRTVQTTAALITLYAVIDVVLL
jgi:signal peptidase I